MNVIAVAAISLDGMIGHDPEHIITTSKQDQAYFERTTRNVGVIITGRKTLEYTLKVPLEARRNIVYTHQADLLATPRTDQTWYTQAPPAEVLAELEQEGVGEVAVIGGGQIFTLYHDFIDEWHLTVTPQFAGGGVPLLAPFPAEQLKVVKQETWDTGETLLVLRPKR